MTRWELGGTMDDELPGELAERIRRRNGAATIYDLSLIHISEPRD